MTWSAAYKQYPVIFRRMVKRKGWAKGGASRNYNFYAKWKCIQYRPTHPDTYLTIKDYLWCPQPSLKAYGVLYKERKAWKITNNRTAAMRWKV